MHEMSIFWLRCAAGLYAVGVLHAVLVLLRGVNSLFPFARAAFSAGIILHFVSLVELGVVVGHIPADNFYETISLCGFVFALLFWFVYWRYQFAGIAVFLFPLVFLMTLIGSTELPVGSWSNPRVRDIWLIVHVLLILIGYASLLLTAIASIFYLIRERQLKRKSTIKVFERMPPLGTLDSLVTKSMEVGFVFITLGVAAASTWAFIESGTRWIREAKVGLALVTWIVCLLMVFLRNTAGWRGRRAAMMALVVLGCSALTWAAHVGLRSVLIR